MMIETIQEDIKSAMRSGDSAAVSTLRMLKGALENARIEHKGELSEEAAIATLRKEAKQRRESAEEYRKAGRDEQASQEEVELTVIERYLPVELSDDELAVLVDEAVAESKATSMQDMGAVMRVLQPKVAGRADGGRVAGAVRHKLQ